MSDKASDLVVGEVIEIKYRVSRISSGGEAPEFADRWITAEIIHRRMIRRRLRVLRTAS
jgi:hypothetical protein